MRHVEKLLFLAALTACSGGGGPTAPIFTVEEAAPQVCPHGGTLNRFGYDRNGDGHLDDTETQESFATCDGGPGANSLLEVTTASVTDCPGGGSVLRTGFDDDGDGVLQAAERDATAVLCRGEPSVLVLVETSPGAPSCPGERGAEIRVGPDVNRDGQLNDTEVTQRREVCAGEAATPTLVSTRPELPGPNCERGGTRYTIGRDDDGDGTLDPPEVEETGFFCRPASSIVDVALEDAATSTVCPSRGGTRITSGLDEDGDGALASDEVDRVAFVCHGLDGQMPLTVITTEAPGANCAVGGRRVEVGVDANFDDQLSPTEVQSVGYVCDGEPAGSGTALRVRDVPPGPPCVSGGVAIETGPDADGDGVLDEAEIQDTRYVCHGAAALVLVEGEIEPPGANCAAGGLRFAVGIDADGDGTLATTEQSETSFMCGANAAIPFVVDTPRVLDGLVGQPFDAALEAFGGIGGVVGWSIVSGALPTGLGLQPAGAYGRISGTPTVVQTATFEVEAADFFGTTTRRTYTLRITQPFTVSAVGLPRVRVGVPYQGQLAASAPVASWRIVAGSLPAGLTLNAATGEVQGTPTEHRGHAIVVEAVTADGRSDRARVLIPGTTRWVAVVQTEASGARQVFVADVEGALAGPPVRVSPALAPNAPGAEDAIDQYETDKLSFSSGGRLAFMGDFADRRARELWVAELRGAPSVAVRVHPVLPAGRNVGGFAWAPDADVLVYTTDVDERGAFDLYAVRFGPSGPLPPVRLTELAGSFGRVIDFAPSPDGSQVAFIADFEVAGRRDLYVVSTTTPTPELVQRAVDPGRYTSNTYFAPSDPLVWSPDSRWVVAPMEASILVVRTSTAGATAREYGGVAAKAEDVRFAPTSDKLVYGEREGTAAPDTAVFVVDLAAAGSLPPVRVDDGTGAFRVSDFSNTQWSPDGDGFLANGPNPNIELAVSMGSTRWLRVLPAPSATLLPDASGFTSDEDLYYFDDLANPYDINARPSAFDWSGDNVIEVSITAFLLGFEHRQRTLPDRQHRFQSSVTLNKSGDVGWSLMHEGVGVIARYASTANVYRIGVYDFATDTARTILPTTSGASFVEVAVERPWDTSPSR